MTSHFHSLLKRHCHRFRMHGPGSFQISFKYYFLSPVYSFSTWLLPIVMAFWKWHFNLKNSGWNFQVLIWETGVCALMTVQCPFNIRKQPTCTFHICDSSMSVLPLIKVLLLNLIENSELWFDKAADDADLSPCQMSDPWCWIFWSSRPMSCGISVYRETDNL